MNDALTDKYESANRLWCAHHHNVLPRQRTFSMARISEAAILSPRIVALVDLGEGEATKDSESILVRPSTEERQGVQETFTAH